MQNVAAVVLDAVITSEGTKIDQYDELCHLVLRMNELKTYKLRRMRSSDLKPAYASAWLRLHGFMRTSSLSYQCFHDVCKYLFTNRIADLWNSLPKTVVSVQSLQAFKYRVSQLNL